MIFKQGLARTNKMREKGRKKEKYFIQQEYKKILKDIYEFNLEQPNETDAILTVKHKEVISMLEKIGYKITKREDNQYLIIWEETNEN